MPIASTARRSFQFYPRFAPLEYCLEYVLNPAFNSILDLPGLYGTSRWARSTREAPFNSILDLRRRARC